MSNDATSGNKGTDEVDEVQAFRDAMAGVEPLADKRKVDTARTERMSDASAQARRRRAEGGEEPPEAHPLTLGEVRQVEPHDVLSWKKDGVQLEVFARLRGGGYPIERDLDLHGLTVAEARDAVRRFIEKSRAAGIRSVRIAHGRGEKSATPARLKSYLAHWLEHWDVVLAFHSAQRHHGGTGAVYALLRKSAAKKAETRERFGIQGHDA